MSMQNKYYNNITILRIYNQSIETQTSTPLCIKKSNYFFLNLTDECIIIQNNAVLNYTFDFNGYTILYLIYLLIHTRSHQML